MMFNFPNFYPPFYRRYPKYYYNDYYYNNNQKTVPSSEICKPLEEKGNSSDDTQFFEIFGIKLFFDDILLICLIFFLYNEGVKDQSLFLSLIMLLLS